MKSTLLGSCKQKHDTWSGHNDWLGLRPLLTSMQGILPRGQWGSEGLQEICLDPCDRNTGFSRWRKMLSLLSYSWFRLSWKKGVRYLIKLLWPVKSQKDRMQIASPSLSSSPKGGKEACGTLTARASVEKMEKSLNDNIWSNIKQ